MSEVSGLHCTIFSLAGDFELEDASRNGTYWNDARLLKAELLGMIGTCHKKCHSLLEENTLVFWAAGLFVWYSHVQ